MESDTATIGALVAAIIALSELAKLLVGKLLNKNGAPGGLNETLKEISACMISMKVGMEGIRGALEAIEKRLSEADKDIDEIKKTTAELLVRVRTGEQQM